MNGECPREMEHSYGKAELRGALEEREESSKPGKTQCFFLIQIVLRAALKWP